MPTYADQGHAGYYDVKVTTHKGVVIRRVYAVSDYTAALKVRQETGIMPRSQEDVTYVESSMQSRPVTTMFA